MQPANTEDLIAAAIYLTCKAANKPIPGMPEKKRRKFNTCPNCEYQFKGVDNYCPNCGQENHNLNVPFSHVALEVLEGTLHFDTKIFKTLKLLLFKPGELTRLFVENKRAYYVPPVRLYVFISFIFFLVLSSDVLHRSDHANAHKNSAATSLVIGKQPAAKPVHGPVAFDFGGLNSEDIKRISLLDDQKIDSVLRKNGFAATAFNQSAIKKIGKFLGSSDEEQTHKFLKVLSMLMFLLMPVFGLILKSAYSRHNSRYIQHLVFSVHYHCFVFIVLIFMFLAQVIFGLDFFVLLAWSLILLYLFLALLRLFKQSFVKTFLKTVYVAAAYAFTLVVFIVLAVILSIALT